MTLTRIGLPGPFAGSAHRMRFEQSSNCITARCSCGWSVTYDKDEPQLPCQDDDEIHGNDSRPTSMVARIGRQIRTLIR